ncbi:RNA polymerase subunit sigma-70, partial [Leptolyngbya valderiana BDU 20041]
VAAGDQRAFARLVDRHQKTVRGVLMRLCRNHALADDLAQDTFIKAYERIADYSGAGALRGWLCRIAYTEFLMHARKRKARDRTLDRFKAEPGEDHAPPGPGAARVDLDRALATLGEEERTCVVLCYAAGMSHSEAAETTGLPLGTVKSHVNRGRTRLKAWFARKEAAA